MSAGKEICRKKFYNILLHIDSASNRKGRGRALNMKVETVLMYLSGYTNFEC